MVRAKAPHTFSPREFLKQRRPERFSDSVGLDAPLLDRSLLEYHLSTITSRNQEQRFEEFARRLLQKTVCPNLLPHTGPTGGGDSKVDTETYPVAAEVSAQWYMAQPNAGAERWAVGISAKKAWRGKVQDDVAKIVGTGRPYTKILCVSSQHIPDKKRAEVEDALTKQHGTDVRVFDRQWILDQVFALRLEELAIETLGIETSVRREVRKGPLD
ncbi:MAG: hypothetical protein JWM26_1633, partial [Betaproteobacteria bacterium]|nr:hypothetical protein [Betaproteobacteria bacterium]